MTDKCWKECTNHHEHEWEEQVATLKAELELVKSNYEYLKGDWNNACELAKEHCPCPLGTSHITDGIPRLAERARRLEAEVERLKADPTAEQERKLVLRYLSNRACHLMVEGYSEGSRALERAERTIEKGEHWPEGASHEG